VQCGHFSELLENFSKTWFFFQNFVISNPISAAAVALGVASSSTVGKVAFYDEPTLAQN
jgi:hypothetical protein